MTCGAISRGIRSSGKSLLAGMGEGDALVAEAAAPRRRPLRQVFAGEHPQGYSRPRWPPLAGRSTTASALGAD